MLYDIGLTTKQVHSLDVGGLEDLEPHWPTWISNQRKKAYLRHESFGLPQWFLTDLENYLEKYFPLVPKNYKPVILTGEYTLFNLLFDKSKPDALSGMIDLGDGMIGPATYDLLGPAFFSMRGASRTLGELF